MYRELQPFREALSYELKASLFPAAAEVDPNKLLETYLDRLTMFTGVDVADQTFAALALDAGREILGTLEGCANQPDGFQRFIAWARDLRDQHGLRIIAIAGETSGVYYWALWDFLGEQSDVARVLYNPRTTEHTRSALSLWAKFYPKRSAMSWSMLCCSPSSSAWAAPPRSSCKTTPIS